MCTMSVCSLINMNNSFYNKLELVPPPLLSFKLCCKNPETVSKKIQEIMNSAIATLQNQQLLHQESATLSRLIYNWKLRMRNDKGFKGLQKINRSLLQYLAMDMLSVFKMANGKVFDDYGPSRQVIEWVLVRLQGFSKLFDNTYNRCIEAASYLQWRYQNIWNVALVGTAVVSRILVISMYLIKEACVWYSELKQLLPILQTGVQPWLPDSYKLPEDLTTWLGDPLYLVNRQNENSNVFDFLKEMKETNSLEGSSAMKSSKFDFMLSDNKMEINEDIGEVIYREEENTILPSNTTKNSSEEGSNFTPSNRIKKPSTLNSKTKINKRMGQSDNSNIIDKITSGKKLKVFLRKEKALRSTSEFCNNNQCLTRNLDKLQWRMFENFIQDKLREIKDNPNEKEYFNGIKDEIKMWFS